MASRRSLVATGAVALSLFVGRHARADDDDGVAARCIDDAAKGQRSRDAGKLVESRARFVACSSDACPGVVKRDCVRWLAEVDERLPSVVVSTRNAAGGDLVGATVSLDGVALPTAQLGRAIPIDPGPHEIQTSLRGYRTTTESLVSLEREKSRVVVVVLSREGPEAPPAGSSAHRVPVLPLVLGGVALAGLGGFAFFWARGMDEVGSLRASCAPYCSPDRVDDARTPLTVARISLGVGIAAAIGAIGAIGAYVLSGDPPPARSGTTGRYP